MDFMHIFEHNQLRLGISFRKGGLILKALLVGPPGFEPGTSCTPSKRASQAAPRPEVFSLTQAEDLTRDRLVLTPFGDNRHFHILRHADHAMDEALTEKAV
jgi:hypothetical protein